MLSKEMRSWILNFQPAVEEIDLGKGYQTSCVRKKSWPRIWTRSNIFVILSKFGLSLATVGNSRTSEILTTKSMLRGPWDNLNVKFVLGSRRS